MASTSGTFSTYPSLLTYRVTADELSYDTNANTSQVLVRAYIDFSGFSASSSGGSGSTTPGNWSRGSTSFSGAGSIEVYNSGSFTVGHNTDGSGSYNFSGSASMSGWGSASTGTGTLTLTNITRLPTAPSSVTAVINADKSITVTSGTGTSYGSGANYYVQYAYSSNGGGSYSGWTGTQTMSSRVYTYSGLTRGLTYKFQCWIQDSEGTGSATASSGYFLAAGGKRWTGSAWTPTTIGRRWNGSAWVDLTVAKRWNGSAWVDLS